MSGVEASDVNAASGPDEPVVLVVVLLVVRSEVGAAMMAPSPRGSAASAALIA
jgi:hypothetical protein